MADRLNPNDLLGRRVYWLLDIEWAGMTLRLSDAELDLTTADGESLHYHGVLDTVDVDEGIDFLSDASSSPASASIDCVLPVDVPQLIAQGHDLASGRGTLSRWVEGTDYENRRKLIVGVVSDPEYGTALEPVSFTLEASVWTDKALIPPSSNAVIGENWDDEMILSLSADELGLFYPIVIGQPGRVSTDIGSQGVVTGSQGVYVDHQETTSHANMSSGDIADTTLLVAGHHVVARAIFLNTNDFTEGDWYYVTNAYDRQGHPVAICRWWYSASTGSGHETDPDPNIVDPYNHDAAVTDYDCADPTTGIGTLGDNFGDASFQPDRYATPVGTYCAWWHSDNPDAGGLAGSDGQTMRDAGSILEWILSQSTIPVDRGRFAAAKALLWSYKLDFTIDAQVSPWEYVQTNLLPLLPVSIVSGPSGLYPVVWRYDATADDAVCHFDTDVDPYIERSSNVSYDRDHILNDFKITYALSVRTGNYQAEERLTADGADGSLVSYACFISQHRYKQSDGTPLVASDSIETPCVYDTPTAVAILQWRARAYALARRRVEYLVPETIYGWLERGNVVTITDPDVHLDRQVALIENIRTDGSPMLRVRLLIIEDMARDSRLVD